jgi:iron complex transport system substrate-binding protein
MVGNCWAAYDTVGEAPMIDRRQFCSGLMLGALAAGFVVRADPLRSLNDMAGRTVRLATTPRRIILLEARDMLTMALLHDDPASLVVGWAAVDRLDSTHVQTQWTRHGHVAVVGKQGPDTVSLEGIIALAPDLVVVSAYMASPLAKDGIVEHLERLGIAVVFTDVASNSADPASPGPIENLHRHLRLWGDILGARDRAEAFLAFVDGHLNDVNRRLAGAPAVTTYLEVQSTLDDCCWAAGKQVWGELLALAGGQTLPGVSAPWFQKIQLEYLITTPQEVYIASGGEWSSGGRPAIAPGIDPAKGREGLRRLLDRAGFANLPSVRNQRVHGIWTGLITMMPLNLLFIEVAAKWLHPERFFDVDPAGTLAQINSRFLSEPLIGPLWVSLQE